MKLPFLDQKLSLLALSKKKIRTKSRDSVINENMVGTIMSIYNGKRYYPVAIVKKMIGHKLGEFVYTKMLGKSIHSSARNKKKLTKQKK
ncbi:MAG: ribosomal protein S19 family protein [Cyanobacteriota bacterium]|nr:MAG: ribosomal protein S19 family protein [Cyanobacteriota bacterium]